jgi:osmoprotectant transport system permease protein
LGINLILKMKFLLAIFLLLLVLFCKSEAYAKEEIAKAELANQQVEKGIIIGSKKFTESYVLGEIGKEQFIQNNIKADHKQGMGGTLILWQALKSKQIDIYPEYTGTIKEAILKSNEDISNAEMKNELQKYNIGMTDYLGFNNTYALAMKREISRKLNIHKISDLHNFPDLKYGFSHEFLNRKDGWKDLIVHYKLKPKYIRGIDQSLAYKALNQNLLDVMDAYSTDSKIQQLDLVLLEDDYEFFPKYQAVFLYRLDLPTQSIHELNQLSGSFSQDSIISLNLEAENSRSYHQAALKYFGLVSENLNNKKLFSTPINWSSVLQHTFEHINIVCVSMILAILIGIPLGIIASNQNWITQLIMSIVSIIQTIPSLALLALLVAVPGFGISIKTALFALFLYSLLPIVKNTAIGFQNIPLSLRESTEVLGLSQITKIRKIYIPLAARSILGGIKTSTIVNIGTAVLAALIGRGGLGESIISGLNLNDTKTILEGALPAAFLALLTQVIFYFLDKKLIPKGLQMQALGNIHD